MQRNILNTELVVEQDDILSFFAFPPLRLYFVTKKISSRLKTNGSLKQLSSIRRKKLVSVMNEIRYRQIEI